MESFLVNYMPRNYVLACKAYKMCNSYACAAFKTGLSASFQEIVLVSAP